MLTDLQWKGKTAFFWAGCAAITTVWAYYRLPEARGRTYEELDILFAKGVSARKFASHKIDAYAIDAQLVRNEGEENLKSVE